MYILYSLVAVLILGLMGYLGGFVTGLRVVFGVILPYAAIGIFLMGVAYRVVCWTRSPVPFRITTSCGQQRSLPWIKAAWLENPSTTLGVIARIALEVLLFRSLFRNTKAVLREGPRLVFDENKFLWLGALAFHWSFLFIFLRHLRFFIEPVPAVALWIQNLDGFFQVGTPALFVTDILILAALTYLLIRRLIDPQIRYISLFTDYFALFLLLGLAGSGAFMRYFVRSSIVEIKELAMGLVTFSPVVPAG
ncbi:MAG: sulfate reduction electron transfer complex DsrMKJOP subunit DsrM, partial [Acidobacteriota bacterium]